MRRNIYRWLASCGGLGYCPIAPGTVASFLALCIGFVADGAIGPIAVVSLALGLFLCGPVERDALEKDPSFFVLDEFCGMSVALWGIPSEGVFWIAAFLLFRLFDVWKPGPIRRIQNRSNPTAIMWDDVAAGLLANLAVRGLTYLL